MVKKKYETFVWKIMEELIFIVSVIIIGKKKRYVWLFALMVNEIDVILGDYISKGNQLGQGKQRRK
jgi:hypothetical protein